MGRGVQPPREWEAGALCRTIWGDGGRTTGAAWRELGRRAAQDEWALRLLLDVAEGRLSPPSEAAASGLHALAELRPERVTALLRDTEARSAHVAAMALGREGEKYLPDLGELTRDAEVSARLTGIAGLAEAASVGCLPAVGMLGAMLDDPARGVRWAAAAALGRARGAECAERALGLLSGIAQQGDDSTLPAVILGAAALSSAEPDGSSELLFRLTDSSREVRRAMALAACNLPEPAASRAARRCLRDADPYVRALIVDALCRWAEGGSAEARRDLAGLAADAHPVVRAAAAEAVARDPEVDSPTLVRRLAGDRSAKVRCAVAKGLGNRSTTDARDLLRQLAKDRSAHTRAAAIRSLGAKAHEGEALEAYFDTEAVVRAAAAEALGSSRRNVPLLLSLLDDRSPQVAQAAIRGLSRWGLAFDGPIWERLVALTASPSLWPAVAEAVAGAFSSRPGALFDLLYRWPSGDGACEIMWQIAKAARTAEVANLARAAARCFDVGSELQEALDDACVAAAAAGREDMAEALSWLRQCAQASSVDDIAQMHVGAPAEGTEGVMLLAEISRVAAQALRAGERRSEERQIARTLARVDTVLALQREPASWSIVHRIARQWHALLEGRSALARPAEVRADLVSRRVLADGPASVLVRVENIGGGKASGIVVRLGSSVMRLPALPSGAEVHLALPIGDPPAGMVPVTGSVRYRDGRGVREAHFEGRVAASHPGKLAAVPNPYVVGKPLAADSPMFFGRAELLSAVERALGSGGDGSAVMLVGQRRTGKTSLLRQLERRLARQYRPAFVDVQGMMVSDTDGFFREMSALASGGALADSYRPDQGQMGRTTGVDTVREAAGASEMPLLLLLDEFDDLEEKVRSQRLGPQVFAQLRHLIQHTHNLRLVLSGTHRLEELAGEYWSSLFNLAACHRVGCLAPETAAEVITAPLQELGIVCEDAAVNRAVELTGGQPYLMQLLGYRLVESCVACGRGAVRTALVAEAADELAEQGEIHLRYLSGMAGGDGREVLAALGEEFGLSVEEISAGCGLSRGTVSKALTHLSQLELAVETAGWWKPRIGLLGRWLKAASAA